MKYERLTNRGEPFYGFEKCKTCEYGKDGCDNWCDQITGCFCRLQELEDKIERANFASRKLVKMYQKNILLTSLFAPNADFITKMFQKQSTMRTASIFTRLNLKQSIARIVGRRWRTKNDRAGIEEQNC